MPRRIARGMRLILGIIALGLLCSGHWIWALLLVLIIIGLSSEPTPSYRAPGAPASAPPASYTPTERHEHPAARVRRETTLVPYIKPAGPADTTYGVDAFAFRDWLASPTVFGTPAGGLEDDGVESGMEAHNVAAGVKGEVSVAHMLASMDLGGAHVYMSCRNPGDPTGRADIDLIVATGSTVWLLDAKHYAPMQPNMWLVPDTGDPSSPKPFELRAYGPNANVIGTPLHSLDPITPDREYHASGNMAWATDVVRKALPGVDVIPAILLSRTRRGTYGVTQGTMFPGGIPVRTADQWRDTFPSEGEPVQYIDSYLKSLVKKV